jgi:hypoxanthine phosphoribosyltransferase
MGWEWNMGIMDQDLAKTLFSGKQISQRIKEMGQQITQDYAGKDLLMVGILKGAVIFYGNLIKAVDLPVTMDFLMASSYGSGMVSSGNLQIKYDLCEDVAGRDVLLVDDIVDTGLTLKALVEEVQGRGAASVRTCCLLDKPARRKVEIEPDYIGFEIPDMFVVGYGMDYDGKYRNLPKISVLKPEAYQ